MTTNALRNVSQKCVTWLFSKTIKNKNGLRAKKQLSKYAQKMKANDPVEVNPSSGTFVLYLIYEYWNMCTVNSKEDNTVTGFIHGLRIVYQEAGHTTNWFANKKDRTAHGNPLTANPELAALRSAHRVFLARNNMMKLRKRPLSVSHVCGHAKKFWFGKEGMEKLFPNAAWNVGQHNVMNELNCSVQVEGFSCGSYVMSLVLLYAVRFGDIPPFSTRAPTTHPSNLKFQKCAVQRRLAVSSNVSRKHKLREVSV